MFSVSPEISRLLFQLSRYLFAFLSVIILFSAVGWVFSENRLRKKRLRRLPSLGMIGELVVLSGSHELPAQTWFPLPREGVLGSFRSCDLVVPGGGVRPRHLDFRWQDGAGLLIRPRSGCEVLVNGTPLTCRTDTGSVPLLHGSYLQVGSIILQLRLFAAMDQSVRVAQYPDEESSPASAALPSAVMSLPPRTDASGFAPASASSGPSFPEDESVQRNPDGIFLPSEPPAAPAAAASGRALRASSDTAAWKEDWGE